MYKQGAPAAPRSRPVILALVIMCALLIPAWLWMDVTNPWHFIALAAYIVLGVLLAAFWPTVVPQDDDLDTQPNLLPSTNDRSIERAAITLHSITDAVLTTDINGQVDYMNPAAERLSGWALADARMVSVHEVLRLVHDKTGLRYQIPLENCIRQGEAYRANNELILLSKEGHRNAIHLTVSPLCDREGVITGAVMVLQDVARERKLSQMLTYQATHDDLTGLVNRREFERRVKKAMQGTESGQSHVLCYMDLDQFKLVNDTCGHIAGDRLLKQLAVLIKPSIREEDTLARLGGDEFGILLEQCSLEDAREIADHIIQLVKSYRFSWSGKTFEISASIGIVHLTTPSQSLVEVMSHADSACYLAKEAGGNKVHTYHPEDDAMLKRQDEMRWAHRITQAYSEKRFVLYAQQILPLRPLEDQPAHYEILLRMLDDAGKTILPMEYISAAERYNLMADLDRWVIYNTFQALDKAYKIEDSRCHDMVFAINLSGQSLTNNRSKEFVAQLFDQHPNLAPHIIFEITETAAISNLSDAMDFIDTFRERGVRFSLDDFGSGLSSFSYLKNLNVDYVKIDGEFVKDVGYDPVDFAMVGSINHIGHVMGLKTIAEHVDSDDIKAKLVEIGVDFGQGHGLAEPGPLADVVDKGCTARSEQVVN